METMNVKRIKTYKVKGGDMEEETLNKIRDEIIEIRERLHKLEEFWKNEPVEFAEDVQETA